MTPNMIQIPLEETYMISVGWISNVKPCQVKKNFEDSKDMQVRDTDYLKAIIETAGSEKTREYIVNKS